MKIIAGINAENQSFCITIVSPIMEKYYHNFVGMLKEDKVCPNELEIFRENIDTIHLQFPVPPGAIQGKPVEGRVAVDKDAVGGMQGVLDFVQRFTMAAVKNILKKTEFLPIMDFSGGYSFKEMQKDIVTALENKRDFLLIDSYKNYLANNESQKYEFNQYLVSYGSDEYVNIFILIKSGNLKELRRLYKDKLKLTNWF